jgi:hypothetical protein
VKARTCVVSLLASDGFRRTINAAVIGGDGIGKPMGILHHDRIYSGVHASAGDDFPSGFISPGRSRN